MSRLPHSSTDEWDRGTRGSAYPGKEVDHRGEVGISLALSEMLVVVSRGGGSKWTFPSHSTTHSHAPIELAPLLCSGAGLRDAQ